MSLPCHTSFPCHASLKCRASTPCDVHDMSCACCIVCVPYEVRAVSNEYAVSFQYAVASDMNAMPCDVNAMPRDMSAKLCECHVMRMSCFMSCECHVM